MKTRISSEVEALTGLLDFYSDRAEAHASFMVACIFGLFTWLALAYVITDMLVVSFSIIPYVLIAFTCYHCLQRFTFYAVMAEKYKEELEKITGPEEITVEVKMEGEWKKTNLKAYRDRASEKSTGIPRRFIKQPYRILGSIVLLGLPFAVVYLPKFVVHFFPDLVLF